MYQTVIHKPALYVSRGEGFTGCGGRDGIDERARLTWFEDDPANVARKSDIPCSCVRGQNDYRNCGTSGIRVQAGCDFLPGSAGQPEIQQDHVWLVQKGGIARRRSIVNRRDQVTRVRKLGLADHERVPVVVHDQHAPAGHRTAFAGGACPHRVKMPAIEALHNEHSTGSGRVQRAQASRASRSDFRNRTIRFRQQLPAQEPHRLCGATPSPHLRPVLTR